MYKFYWHYSLLDYIMPRVTKVQYCDMTNESRNRRPRETSSARQRHGKHVSAVTNNHATTEELSDVVFSMWSVSRLYKEDQWESLVSQDVS
jgi:uncharacterized protein YabN with tetrapyrrole methylase and pyrophosphatase domain